MPNLTRTTLARPASARSKLLLVRQPARAVRRVAETDRTPLRLTIGVMIAVGVVAAVWLMGHLGFRLGFARIVRVPDLLGEPGGGLATGAMMLVSAPRMIFGAGLAHPAWLMLGFASIALPAAGLGAARPMTPGGPRLRAGLMTMAALGATFAMLSSSALIWWSGSPLRAGLVRSLPLDPAAVSTWARDLEIAAGLDVLAVVSAALWVVLAFRLPIPLWLRAISVSATLFTLVVVTVTMAMSNATAAQIGSARAEGRVADDASPRLVLGATEHHLALLTVHDGRAVIEMRIASDVSVEGSASIVTFLSAP